MKRKARRRILSCGETLIMMVAILACLFSPPLAAASSAAQQRPPSLSSVSLKGRGGSQDDDAETQVALTDNITDFSHSWSALRIFVFHTIVYYALAAIGFTALEPNNSVIDALYFATTMFTTVGYGDVTATTKLGRYFTTALGAYGICILGIFVGIAGDYLVEQRQAVQQERERHVHQSTLTSVLVEHHEEKSRNRRWWPRKEPQESTTAVQTPRNVPQQKALIWEILDDIIRSLPSVLLVLVCAVAIGRLEGWTIPESAYWAAITGSTTGLGDYAPTRPVTRLASVVLLPVTVAIFGNLLARIASTYMDREEQSDRLRHHRTRLTLADLERLDLDQSGSVDKAEFLVYMLVALQKVNKEHDIDPLLELFDELDASKNGKLDRRDIQLLHKKVAMTKHHAAHHAAWQRRSQ